MAKRHICFQGNSNLQGFQVEDLMIYALDLGQDKSRCHGAVYQSM